MPCAWLDPLERAIFVRTLEMLAFTKVCDVNARADRAAGQIWLCESIERRFYQRLDGISAPRRTDKPGFRITYKPARIKSTAVARIDAGVMLIAE